MPVLSSSEQATPRSRSVSVADRGRPASEAHPPETGPRSASLFPRLLTLALSHLTEGQLSITDGDSTKTFGAANSDFVADIQVLDRRFYRSVVLGGSMAAAEAYRMGYWQSTDLVAVIRLLARNRNALEALGGRAKQLINAANRLAHRFRRNTRNGSRKNISAHYDLSNDFFRIFLDETMTYSSGIFPTEQSSMRDASLEKYARICRELKLSPNDHVLEVGCGWGGFATYAAKQIGCHVTATTISAEQYGYAEALLRREHLTDKVTLLKQDYRDLTGQFDKLVSIEMIEAVGHEYLPTYFQRCSDLLRPNGAMLLQAITIPDQRYEQYRRSVDFIQRYIFPGGCLPSLGAISDAMARGTDLRLVQLQDFGHHYARTLQAWRQAFHANLDKVRALGMDEIFLRTWNYYLCYCEGAFWENQVGVSQLLLHKPKCPSNAGH